MKRSVLRNNKNKNKVNAIMHKISHEIRNSLVITSNNIEEIDLLISNSFNLNNVKIKSYIIYNSYYYIYYYNYIINNNLLYNIITTYYRTRK